MSFLDESVSKQLLRKQVDAQEAWLQEIFGPGGPLQGEQDKYVLEEFPLETTLQRNDDPNSVVFRFSNTVRLRHKTLEEMSNEAKEKTDDEQKPQETPAETP